MDPARGIIPVSTFVDSVTRFKHMCSFMFSGPDHKFCFHFLFQFPEVRVELCESESVSVAFGVGLEFALDVETGRCNNKLYPISLSPSQEIEFGRLQKLIGIPIIKSKSLSSQVRVVQLSKFPNLSLLRLVFPSNQISPTLGSTLQNVQIFPRSSIRPKLPLRPQP